MNTDFEELRKGRFAMLSEDEKVEYAHAYEQAGLAGALAELVYALRSEAGISQSEPTMDLLDRLGRGSALP